MTVSWCGASSKRRRRRAESSFPIPRKRSPWRARCSWRVLGARDENGTLRPLDVRTGDRVLFGTWSGTEIKIDGEELVVMKESDIMGVDRGCCGPLQEHGRIREV
jgi:co-chaperonin GroES (HSP10)